MFGYTIHGQSAVARDRLGGRVLRLGQAREPSAVARTG